MVLACGSIASVIVSRLPWHHPATVVTAPLTPAASVAAVQARLPSATTAAAAVAERDPVKQLDSLINTRSEPSGFKFYNVKYDVEKTNSLTAPYTAVITGTHIWNENEKPKQMKKFVLYAEYRNGEWCYSRSEGQTTYFEGEHVTTLSFDPAIDEGKSLARDLQLKVSDY